MTNGKLVLDNEVEVEGPRGHRLVDHSMGVQCEACNYIFINEGAVQMNCPFAEVDEAND